MNTTLPITMFISQKQRNFSQNGALRNAQQDIFATGLSLLMGLALLLLTPAAAQPVADAPVVPQSIPMTQDASKSDDAERAIPVAFPGILSPKPQSAPEVVVPVPVPVTVAPIVLPKSLELAKNSLSVTRMNGEVHFKHLQGPRLDPSRALYIETGNATSWCEFKMQNLWGRAWTKSQVSVFPEAGVIYLNRGALIVHVDKTAGSTFSVIAGNYVCRVHGTTLRVQKDERSVNFQVTDGTVTVYNRQTGEVFKAGQVTQPAR